VQHGFGMSALAAFSWWGALQGFGPAIAIAIKGLDRSMLLMSAIDLGLIRR